MSLIYISYNENPELWVIATSCGYTGRHLQATTFPEEGHSIASCWCEGERDYYYLYHLVEKRLLQIPENGSPFIRELTMSALPPNTCLVRVHEGRWKYCEIMFESSQITKVLPVKKDLSYGIKVVLYYTRHLKSTYMGVTRRDHAVQDNMLTVEEWEEHKGNAISKGYLNHAGAITTKGKNAISSINHKEQLKEGI